MFKLFVEGILDYMDRRNAKQEKKFSPYGRDFNAEMTKLSESDAEKLKAVIPMEKKKRSTTSLEHPEVSPPDGCPACRRIADKW